jgi:DNA polymerase III alpha subunit (gram-positive type)
MHVAEQPSMQQIQPKLLQPKQQYQQFMLAPQQQFEQPQMQPQMESMQTQPQYIKVTLPQFGPMPHMTVVPVQQQVEQQQPQMQQMMQPQAEQPSMQQPQQMQMPQQSQQMSEQPMMPQHFTQPQQQQPEHKKRTILPTRYAQPTYNVAQPIVKQAQVPDVQPQHLLGNHLLLLRHHRYNGLSLRSVSWHLILLRNDLRSVS